MYATEIFYQYVCCYLYFHFTDHAKGNATRSEYHGTSGREFIVLVSMARHYECPIACAIVSNSSWVFAWLSSDTNSICA